MSIIPEDLKYTKEHEWVRIDGGVATIGVTDYAQHEAGDIVFLELPKVGASVSQGQAIGVLETVKSVSDIYSPISGTVAEVNAPLAATPENINKDAYSNWVCKITSSKAAELEGLLSAMAYAQLVGEA